jgi:hypothetical protein
MGQVDGRTASDAALAEAGGDTICISPACSTAS